MIRDRIQFANDLKGSDIPKDKIMTLYFDEIMSLYDFAGSINYKKISLENDNDSVIFRLTTKNHIDQSTLLNLFKQFPTIEKYNKVISFMAISRGKDIIVKIL